MNKKNKRPHVGKRKKQDVTPSDTWLLDYDRLQKYAALASGSGSTEQLSRAEAEILTLSHDILHLSYFAEISFMLKPAELRSYVAELLGRAEIMKLLEKSAPRNCYCAHAWFCYGGYEKVRTMQAVITQSEASKESGSSADAAPDMLETASVSALQTDLAFAKKKIQRLESEIAELQENAGKEKLINIISSVAPACNELRMYIAAMEHAGIDADTLAGYSSALQTISNSLIDAGATAIDEVGAVAAYNPTIHYCINRIARGSEVIVTAPGFMVDEDVIVPAVVEKLEE